MKPTICANFEESDETTSQSDVELCDGTVVEKSPGPGHYSTFETRSDASPAASTSPHNVFITSEDRFQNNPLSKGKPGPGPGHFEHKVGSKPLRRRERWRPLDGPVIHLDHNKQEVPGPGAYINEDGFDRLVNTIHDKI